MPNDQATPLQNAFGLTFTVFSAWYFLRVVKKRGDAAKKFRVANSLRESAWTRTSFSFSHTSFFTHANNRLLDKILQEEERERRDSEQLTRARNLQSFVGGITAVGISLVLYSFAQSIQASLDNRPVPELYQIRQISSTVRTIIEGLAYLATFVYAANGTGLVALSIKKKMDASIPRDTETTVESQRRSDTDLHRSEKGTDGE